MSVSILDPATLSHAVRERARACGVEPVSMDGLFVRPYVGEHAFELRVRLPTTYHSIALYERELSFGATSAIDAVDQALHQAAAALRGHTLRTILDARSAVDWVGDPAHEADSMAGDTRSARAERIALRLAEEADRVMKLAAVYRARGE